MALDYFERVRYCTELFFVLQNASIPLDLALLFLNQGEYISLNIRGFAVRFATTPNLLWRTCSDCWFA